MRNQSTIVVIGGDVRHSQLDRLRATLTDAVIEWIPTRDTDPGASRFKFRLLHDDIALVVMLCGLVRHQHARDITRLCRRHGRRLLHLHRSLNVHRVAAAKGTP